MKKDEHIRLLPGFSLWQEGQIEALPSVGLIAAAGRV